MLEEERRSILDQLELAPAALKGELENLSDQQAVFRPNPDGWSILDCVEHLTIAEGLMFRLISSRYSSLETAKQGREDQYLKNAANRSRKFNAPPATQPHERFSSIDLALASFLERRTETIGYIQQLSDDLRSRTTIHPVAGEITCRECLALMIGHPLRHLEQIREIKQSPDFPSS